MPGRNASDRASSSNPLTEQGEFVYPTTDYKARVERARTINKATVLLLLVTLGMVTGYLASIIGKAS